ncbi:MAG: hypothetical protein LQ349_004318 [Xanthoria aureola]|nr:MAG: hypothetical protein LQ349_004318 [Xanthoria aureola]
MFHQRLSSAYLPDQDYSDYLVDQYLDIQDICSASTMPELTTRGPFYYATATASANATASATAATASSTGPSPSCLGQIVDTGANVTSSNATEACNQLSLLHGVTTGDLQAISGGDDCYTPEPVCLPAACSLLQVPAGATCDSIAAGLTNNITYVQFLSWNPNIIGLCDLLQEGQYICESAPGGSYIPPPNPTGDTGAGGHERGGPGGADPTAISGTVTTLVTSTPLGQVPTAAPAPTQAGIIPICNSYAKAVGGDYCQKFAQANSITPDQLYAWNNILGSGGSNCSIQFFANYYYCVGVSGGTATSSLPPAPTTTSTTAPSPTQTGIPSYCNKYGQAQPGTSCSAFASSNQVSPNDLYAWNPILGASGTNCNTQLFAGYYYCTGIAVPSPIQAGSAGNCNNYAEAVDGDYCFKFAQDKGITTDQLYTWNTVLGAGGANCGTQFFKGYWYCVGVDG